MAMVGGLTATTDIMIPGYADRLYKAMAEEMARIKGLALPEEQELEALFAACMGCELKLDAWLRGYSFDSPAGEIYFFKSVRPKSACLIEYYKKRYHSILFRPTGAEKGLRFLEYERDKASAFIAAHAGFYRYCQQGRTDRDAEYFTRSCGDGSRPGDPCRSGTFHGSLLSVLMGLDMYVAFVKEAIDRLGNGPFSHN